MFNGDRLNDDYEIHKRRNGYITRDELEYLEADAPVFRPRWYNGFLAQIGERLIKVGQTMKEQNARNKATDLPASMRHYETFPK